MSTRKYFSEFGLHVASSYVYLTQQDELANDAIGPTHISLICRRPRITLDPHSVHVSADVITGEFLIHLAEERTRIPFRAANLLGETELTLDCPYPHARYALLDRTGSPVAGGKVGLLFQHIQGGEHSEADLEVLYVGQSFGHAGERTAP